jgi:hypothetical protein
MVGGLVVGRGVQPGFPGAVDVAGAEDDEFTAACGSEDLQLDESPDLPTDVWLDGVDIFYGHRFDGFGFLRSGSPATQTCDGLESMVGFAADEFILDGPAEDPLDARRLLVDVASTPAFLDHLFAAGLQRQRPEFQGRRAGVQLTDDSRSGFKV